MVTQDNDDGGSPIITRIFHILWDISCKFVIKFCKKRLFFGHFY